MHSSVIDPYVVETAELEGNIPHMYADSLGYVTVGLGHKIESNSQITTEGIALPFRRYADDKWATSAEILHDFTQVKRKGGDYRKARTVAKLYLTGGDREHDFNLVLREMEDRLKGYLQWDTLPADAQLAVLSMAWNLGPFFLSSKSPKVYWPDLHKQLRTENFYGAALNCEINGKPSTRNRYNRAHFFNAGAVKALGLNLNTAPENSLSVKLDVLTAAFAGSSTQPSRDAWNVQAILKSLGLYTSALDGIFGKVSQKAFSDLGSADQSVQTRLTRAASRAGVNLLVK